MLWRSQFNAKMKYYFFPQSKCCYQNNGNKTISVKQNSKNNKYTNILFQYPTKSNVRKYVRTSCLSISLQALQGAIPSPSEVSLCVLTAFYYTTLEGGEGGRREREKGGKGRGNELCMATREEIINQLNKFKKK